MKKTKAVLAWGFKHKHFGLLNLAYQNKSIARSLSMLQDADWTIVRVQITEVRK